MTKFYLHDLDKWSHQNNATVLDIEEGCLLDNLLVSTRRGYAGIYEHYLNSQSSNYYVEFQAGEGDTVLDNWIENFRLTA